MAFLRMNVDDMKERSAIRVLFTFDLDGVLHINPFQRKVFPDICRRLAPLLSSIELSGSYEAPSRDRVGEGLSVHQHERRVEDAFADDDERAVMRLIVSEAKRRLRRGDLVAAYDWDGIVNSVASRLGFEGAFDVRAMVEAACIEPYIGLHPHAKEILGWLTGKGVRLFTLSNGFDSYQYPVMETLGIAPFFERRISPDQVGDAKPQPRMFREAAALAGAKANVRVHVGDSLIHDVFGAKQAGFLSVWIHPEVGESLPGATPWDRPSDPAFAKLLQRVFARELNISSYGIRSSDEALPDFAIGNLIEIKEVYERLIH